MQRIGRGRMPVDPALAWSDRLRVEVGGAGTLAHAGVVLPRLLADRLGLTQGLAEVLARAGFIPLRHRGRLLVDAACALAAGATGLTDVEALTRQGRTSEDHEHTRVRIRWLTCGNAEGASRGRVTTGFGREPGDQLLLGRV